jgi:hypothetical protein
MNKLIIGILFGILGQVISFLQLQGSIKYGWFEKHPVLISLSAIPGLWVFIKSVDSIVEWSGGQLWPSRLIGFGIGVITFVAMSWFLFKEPVSLKTMTCLMLAASILLIQIFWK